MADDRAGDGSRAGDRSVTATKAGVTGAAFDRLLACLDPDRARAGVRYEDLRRALVRFFQWRGVPGAEDRADETFDRVARRLDEGVAIANPGGYCYEVARLVAHEAHKKGAGRTTSLDPRDLAATAPSADEALAHEVRLACLESCLAALPGEQRAFILDYYRGDRRGRIDLRRSLAERFGLRRDALANRAQRLRDRLETCVRHCAAKKSAT